LPSTAVAVSSAVAARTSAPPCAASAGWSALACWPWDPGPDLRRPARAARIDDGQ